MLGGPIGSPDFCNQHTKVRVAKAVKLLSVLGEVPDPQVALQLLRRCGAFCKMVYSIRVVPAGFHEDAVGEFDASVRACFEQFTGLHPDDAQWTQATLSTASGGLGLRSLGPHSNAAFLASRSSCFKLCQDFDPDHTFLSTDGSVAAPERVAAEAFNDSVNDDQRLVVGDPDARSQKALSRAVDERASAVLAGNACMAHRAHLGLVSGDGAGLWLEAAPSVAAKLSNEPVLFVAMLRRWLRMPFADADSRCPCCDGWLDRFGDHALACCGAGDRTRRHNLIRNLVYHAASAAGLSPELEKPGLLAQRPSSGSAYENGASCRTGDNDTSFRRPADVFIPRWRSGPPAAWDFAVAACCPGICPLSSRAAATRSSPSMRTSSAVSKTLGLCVKPKGSPLCR